MKFATISKSLMMGLALLLATSAFAATKANLTLTAATDINGTKLSAGDYKVEWDGTGPTVEVSILKGKNVVAKTQAKLVDLQAASPANAAIVMKNSDGSDELAGARFEGKKYALELHDTSTNDGQSAAK
jgi:hypothetical protein